MVFINIEGKFNENTYLFDGKVFNVSGVLSVYIIENNDMRIMIDTPAEHYVRKFLKELQEFGLYPIHKILLTHSHWDHISGTARLRKSIKEIDVEVLASENAIGNLKLPDKVNDVYGIKVTPIENVKPLREGDIIDLKGLRLKVLNLFGHTMDSIGILDEKNKNLFPGCAILNRLDFKTFFSIFMPPDFNESEQLKTFERIRNMRNNLNSISLPHYGVWKEEDMSKLLNEMGDLYNKTKNSFIKWNQEGLSLENVALKFIETYTPNSKSFTKENLVVVQFLVESLIKGLKLSGNIELGMTL